MIEDVFNAPVEVSVGEKKYKLEFDNNAYAQTEITLNMGLCKIMDVIIKENNLKYNELFEIFCIGLMKHHTFEEINSVRVFLKNSGMGLLISNAYLIQAAFLRQLFLPEIAAESENVAKSGLKKKTVKKN